MFKSFIKNTPFGISLILLLLAVVFIVAIAPINGNKTLIVRSGSMQPQINVGDLIFVWPKQNYRVGDIIAFSEEGKPQTTVTHRIAAIKNENGQILYQTKGDANKSPDQTLVPQKNVIGTADYSIRDLGRLFAAVKTKNGFLLAAILPAVLVIILELFNIINALKKPKVKTLARPSLQSVQITSHPRPFDYAHGQERSERSRRPDRGSDFVQQNFSSRFRGNDSRRLIYGHPMGLNIPSVSLKSLFASIFEKINFRSLKPDVGLPYYATSFKALLPYAIVVILFTGTTFATTYSDSEESVGNTFRAAASYPSSTPSPSPSASPSPSPSPTTIAQTLVINEVMPDTSCFQGQTEAQWLEVYNGYPNTVNLKNFKLTDGSTTIDLVTANNIDVPSGGFALLAHSQSIWGDDKCFDDNGVITANLGGQLDIDTEFLQLLDANDAVIDTVKWGSQSPSINPLQNQSIERDPDGLDTALGTNFNAADFTVRTTPQPGL